MIRTRHLIVLALLAGLTALAGCSTTGKCTKAPCDKAPCDKAACSTGVCPMTDITKINFMDKAHCPKGDGWKPLFNGRDFSGWKKRHEDREMSWVATNGLVANFSSPEHHGTDIYTDKDYYNCEVYYEYLVPRGSNSGFYLRGRYEIQILSDYGTPASKESNGALYSVAAPPTNVSKKPLEWQCVYAKIVGKKITVFVNGQKVHDNFELTRQTGGALNENYGTPGPILLQGDHGTIMFRNVFVRPLD